MIETRPDTLIPNAPGERHSSWLELFFDLVAVAGVAQLAHLLHGEAGWHDVGLYVVLYLAFWTCWLSLTLYGNVAAERTHAPALLLGMFGLTVMAAAVHGVQEGESSTAFAIAYAATRVLGGNAFGDRREVLLDWPTVSFTAGAVPWTVSIWVDGPARPWLWTSGVVIDLCVTFFLSRERLLHKLQQQYAHNRRRAGAGAFTSEDGAPDPGAMVTVAHTDTEHLAERLGLFTIIVLGEGVYQLVESASEAGWGRGLYLTVPGAFVMLVLLWSLSLRRGRGGIPCLADAAVQPRPLLALHCFVTGAVAALAAGLGVVVEHADGRLPEQTGRLMATGLGAYLLVATAVIGRSGSGGLPRLLAAALPPLALIAVVGVSDGVGRHPALLVWLLVLALVWFSAGTRDSRNQASGIDG
ncbi:low temperature requirement protein A [Streptomyces sp. NPDC005195]|uniref:low temperature requirement protein A n=1 Tax=Streptomyces sp. NPDC005195 TaxID=3154561 RepID=UPI0033B93975